MRPLILFLLLLSADIARAGEFAADFAVVMIDDATEAKIGPYPYDRAVYAQGIEACARLKAKAVVLKFFFDTARSTTGDAALAAAIKHLPVAAEAALTVPEEANQRSIPARYRISDQLLPALMSDDRGWIPIPGVLDAATTLGFVNLDAKTIPLVENYQGASYQSLIVCCLELAAGTTARFESGQRVIIGKGWLPVDQRNVFHGDYGAAEPIKLLSCAKLLANEIPADEIAGRVVILGLDSVHADLIKTDQGLITVHRLFLQALVVANRQLNASLRPAIPSPTVPLAPKGS